MDRQCHSVLIELDEYKEMIELIIESFFDDQRLDYKAIAQELLEALIWDSYSAIFAYRIRERNFERVVDKYLDTLYEHYELNENRQIYTSKEKFHEDFLDTFDNVRWMIFDLLNCSIVDRYRVYGLLFLPNHVLVEDQGYDIRTRIFELLQITPENLQQLSEQISLSGVDQSDARLQLDPKSGEYEIEYRDDE